MSKRFFFALFGLSLGLVLCGACANEHLISSPTSEPISTKETAVSILEQPVITPTPSPESKPLILPTSLPTAAVTPLLDISTPQGRTPDSFEKTAAGTPTPQATATFAAYGITKTLGTSFENRPIISHRFGFGKNVLVIVGGIHGGYEWNTSVLAYQLIDYFMENRADIPHSVTLYIIPSANPDGQYQVTQTEGRIGAENILFDPLQGRFNGNGVDLNRNWGCEWEEVGYWGDRVVSAGTKPFSEPETQSLTRFILGQKADLVLFFHSAANGIFVGGCPEPLAQTEAFAAIYSEASDYPLFENFSSYPITGDASDWLATQGIASFTVELKAHDTIEFDQNLAGILALMSSAGGE